MDIQPTGKSFTLTELLTLLSLYDVSKKKKLIVVAMLFEIYLENRSFNFYEEVINKFYRRIYLGKSTISVRNNLPLTSQLIDLVTKGEFATSTPIPQEHAKFLFALVKEFLTVIQDLIKTQEYVGDYQHLKTQLEFLKNITQKSKEHHDLLTMFDNTLILIEQQNPLLLESGEAGLTKKEYGSLTLTTPLYKLTKKALLGILENLNLYNREDYFKLVSYAVEKHGESTFCREIAMDYMPVYYTLMEQPNEKLNGTDLSLAMQLGYMKPEDLAQLEYYPLTVQNIDEMYEYYLAFLQKLKEQEVITEDERYFLAFQFLQCNHHHTKKLAQRYIEESSILLQKLSPQFHSHQATTFGEAMMYWFEYDNITEMLVNFHKKSRKSISFGLRVQDGTIKGVWKGTTRKVKTLNTLGYTKSTTIEPRGIVKVSEIEAVHHIQESFIKSLVPYIESGEYYLPEGLVEVVEHFRHGFFHMELVSYTKEEFEPLVEIIGKDFFSKFIPYRISQELLSDDEIKLLCGTDTYLNVWEWETILPFTMLMYVRKAIEKNIISLHDKEDLCRILALFRRGKKDAHAVTTFLYHELRKIHPQTVSFVESLIERKVEEAVESEHQYQNRVTGTVLEYFGKHLEYQGFRKQVFLL